MGLLDGVTQKEYNQFVGNKGNYQFVSLDDIISSFMVVYVGENKILSRVSRTDVQFHGMRAIQELSYDVLRSIKAYEIEVPSNLTMYLPQDYVNYTKIVRVDSNGIEKPIYPTGKTSNPFAIKQNTDGTYFLGALNIANNLTSENTDGTAVTPNTSSTWNNFSSITSSSENYDYDDTDYLRFDNRGRRYG